jgi:hypothetical protein
MKDKNLKQNKIVFCKWITPCLTSSIDRETNLLTIAGIVEEINLPSSLYSDSEEKEIKKVTAEMDLLVLWERVDGVLGEINLDFLLQFVDSKETVLIEMKNSIAMEEHHRRFRARFRIGNLAFTEPGIHYFRVLSLEPEKTGGEVLCTEAIPIKIVEIDKNTNNN